MRKIFSLQIFILVFICATAAFAQTRIDLMEAQELEKKAGAAYEAKNFAAFLQTMLAANKLRANHPRLLYNLADAYALNDKPDEAIKTLKQLADMGLFFEPEKDDDFKSLADLIAFKAVVERFHAVKRATSNSPRAFTFPQKGLIIEGVTVDPVTGDFFLGSIHERKILVRKKDGTVRDLSAPSDGLYGVLGMAVDARRRILWASSSGFAQMKDFTPDQDGQSAIFKYDLKTGKLLNKYPIPNDDGNHALGDMTIAKNGDVYASDSMAPTIYKVAAASDKLEVFLKSDSFASLQGLAFSPDEKYLLAADYSLGFLRIEMATKNVVQITPAENVMTLSADGIAFYKGSIIAVQNGMNPHRVVQLQLDPTFTKFTGYRTLEANHPDFYEPTLGVLYGDSYYLNANSQWGLVSDKGELDQDKLREPVVLKIDLGKK
jgi:hypothetical protein